MYITIEKALKIKEEKLGKEHPSTAATYSNLALVCNKKGDHDRAIELYKNALNVFERKLCKDHPEMATIYNNLAGVYGDKGDYDRAIEFYEKALKIREEKLGKDHPDSAITYGNLASAYEDKGNYDKAIEFGEKALAIFKAGRSYQDILMTLVSLINSSSKATPIDYPKLSNQICEFLELYDFFSVTRAEFISGVDAYFLVKKISERLIINKLIENIKDRMCIERLNKFLRTPP